MRTKAMRPHAAAAAAVLVATSAGFAQAGAELPRSDRADRGGSLSAAAEPTAAGSSAAGPVQERRGRLRAVRYLVDDVFRPEDAGERLIPRAMNALHQRTQQQAIERELFFAPGDLVDDSMAQELERNLRALGIFASVECRLVPTSAADVVDLVVRTRDRFTLIFGGGGSYEGGVSGFYAAAGESNFLGRGDRLAGSFREDSEGEFRGAVSWFGLHLLDSWTQGSVRLSRTDEGDGMGAVVERPFKHLRDPRSWRLAGALDELTADYYQRGESAAEAPYRRAVVGGGLAFGQGPRLQRTTLGLGLDLEQWDYGQATGAQADAIRVPGDTDKAIASVSWSRRDIERFAKLTGVDTLGFVQDLAIETRMDLQLAAVWRREDGAGEQVMPQANVHIGTALQPWDRLLVGLSAAGQARWRGDEAVGWSASGRLSAALSLGRRNVVAAQARADWVHEEQDLPVQLLLGADSGLRGYDARLFAGDRRVLVNVEDRYDMRSSLWIFDLGLCAFFDAGWMGEDGGFGRPHCSVGAGLRVGSAPLFGASVLRIDLAQALSDVEGNTDGVALSVAVGQSFTFGGAERP